MHLNPRSPSRDHFRRLTAPDCLDRLQQLQAEHPDSPLAAFACWQDARCWLADVGVRRPASDAVLRPVLVEFRQAPDEQWRRILLYLFAADLTRISSALRPLAEDEHDVFSEVTWRFLEALHRLDLAQRPVRLGQKIVNDTWHDVRQHYARVRAESNGQESLDEEPEDRQESSTRPLRETLGDLDPAFAAVNLQHDDARGRALLKELVRLGRLTKPDYLLLIGHHVYDKSLKELAPRFGLTDEAVKKRHQRALKLLQESAESLSPERRNGPLFPIGETLTRRTRHE